MEFGTGAQNGNSSNEHSEISPSTSQPHVLAVDDSVLDRRVIEKLLKNSSYNVTTVDGGGRALEFLGLADDHNVVNDKNELKVNMIITDYCMPGMTGYELLKRIKQSELREIPVVIMSSENEPSRISRCMDEGAEDFILKPVRMSDVRRLKALRGKVLPGKHTESVRK